MVSVSVGQQWLSRRADDPSVAAGAVVVVEVIGDAAFDELVAAGLDAAVEDGAAGEGGGWRGTGPGDVAEMALGVAAQVIVAHLHDRRVAIAGFVQIVDLKTIDRENADLA